MKLILVTGMPGCGKEEFVSVAEEKGIRIVRMGDIVRAEAENREIEFSDDNVGGFAGDERKKHGFGIWAERTLPRIGDDNLVIDGIRCPQEVEVFRNELKDAEITIIAIHSSPGTRRERLMGRGREDDVRSKEEFSRRDGRELGWGVCTVIALADHMIVNERSVDELRSKALGFLKEHGLVT
jgi:dephospho-CoA kinase